MHLKQFIDPAEFLEVVEGFLNLDESFYNMKLGVTASIASGKTAPKDAFYIALYRDGQVVGCAVRNDIEQPMMITKMDSSALDLLSNHIFNKKILIKGVVGEVHAAENFATLWCELLHCRRKLVTHFGLYEAHSLIIPPHTCSMFVAGESEREIAKEYFLGFGRECFPDKPMDMAILDRQLARRCLYMLKNEAGQNVAMAANTRATTNGGTISLVYTPPEFRGRGYGSIITALVTEKILSEKKFASLFTDLLNPTSNSIYQKIGFRKIGENVHWGF